jgi:hypothetical protein
VRRLIPVFVLGLLLAACNKGTEPTLTTVDQSGTTTTATSMVETTTSSTTTSPDDATTTTAGSLPGYTIAAGGSGAPLVVLLDPGNYSDIDIRNVIEDARDRFGASDVYVVDSKDAVDLVLLDSPTEEQQKILDEHEFARVIGDQLEFLGPYESSGSTSIGS